MPELRRHYFLEEYCIIASERNKRPSDFPGGKSRPWRRKNMSFLSGKRGDDSAKRCGLYG